MRQSGNTLIIGVDGMIGGALMTHLERAGASVQGSYILPQAAGENRFELDLQSDLSSWHPPFPVHTAYICAGITSLDDCRKNPERAERINVKGTMAAAKTLLEQGAFIVFLSSNQVFDGSKPFMESDHPCAPLNEYGRQKAKTELLLREFGDSAAIVRLTKVLGYNSIFEKWVKALKAGEMIRPFTDMTVAPVPLETVVSVLRLVGDRQESGFWQVSGEKDIPYADAAKLCADILAVRHLLQCISSKDSGIVLEAYPKYTSLNIDRIRDTFGIVPPSIEHVIERCCRNSSC